MKFLIQVLLVLLVIMFTAYGYAYFTGDQQLLTTLDYKVDEALASVGLTREDVAYGIQWVRDKLGM